MVTQSVRGCIQCTAQLKSGRRCHKRTSTGTHCWYHLKRDIGLCIKRSQIVNAGTGLWTVRRFKPNEIIGIYHGEILTAEQLCERYPSNMTGDYVLYLRRNVYIDARNTTSCAVRFVNDSSGNTKLRNNAIIKCGSNIMRAGPQGIPENREIFLSYGREYWRTKK